MGKVNFYIPRIDMWNWRLVSRTFVEVQLKAAQRSYLETENALELLDADVDKIEQEIRGRWADANVQVMRGFQARLKEVSAERKRIYFVRKKLNGVILTMAHELGRDLRP